MENRERNHIFHVVNLFFKVIIQNILQSVVLIKLLHSSAGSTVTILAVIGLIVLFIIFAFIRWSNTTFYLSDDSIHYQTGLFSIKKRVIPFEKVYTVDVSQKLVEKILGLARIKIDTGATAKGGQNQTAFLLKENRIMEVKKTILKTEVEEAIESEEKIEDYRISNGQLLKYSFISNTILSGIAIIFVLYNFFKDVLEEFFNMDIFENFGWLFDNGTTTIVMIILFIIILSIILSIIKNFLKYYGFRLHVNDSKLHINYGLLNTKNYSFEVSKIKGVHIKQNVFMQLLNIRTLQIENIGYGNEKGETAVLFPICNKELQERILSNILPAFIYNGTSDRPSRKTLFRFMFKKIIFALILIGVITYFVPYGFISFILLPFATYIGYLEYKNSAIGLDNSLLYMSYNGFFKKESLVKVKDAQAFITSQNYFQKKKGIRNYAIRLYSNAYGKKIKVKNIEKPNIFSEVY